MDEQETRDKSNFLTWYAGADIDDIKKAARINKPKLLELLNKYQIEIEIIDIQLNRASLNAYQPYK